MSIMSYNGGVVMAMTGKDCVAIAADKRLGIRYQSLTSDYKRVFEMGQKLYIGIPGLATDTQTVFQKLRFRLNMYELRENRKISPQTFTSMVSNMLYERRFGPYFVEPVIAGLDANNKPYIATMDSIGCYDVEELPDFVVAGTCADQAYGLLETYWEKDMNPDQLFEAISQALMNACDRDAVSGLGAVVYIIEKDKVTVKHLKTRMD
ncbi:proteasome subunit beta type-3-like protein [Leptotrombidium deliense]|uniref:Proteasome subunit beta n=1 Tax=Leptotrombidium deliense TaxID=299467 RepID=A0A443S3H2_9ACAR|nr:proteasome subunit beta type-3-like protein [Leptotrombidium deliense]